MDNFDFLKDVDKDLFNIAKNAEKLFKDGYFEQCMIQTRRLGECLCRGVMGDSVKPNDTFDNMLATLKDTPNPSEPEREFLDDLYFIKKAGNMSAHSSKTNNDANAGKDALECLERAFEASLNYAVFKCGADEVLLNSVFDEELLMTGKKSKSATLQEQYTAKHKEMRKLQQEETKFAEESFKKPKKKKNKKTNMDLYEEYLEMKNKAKKTFREKPIWREILETVLAGVIIYVVYLLIFTK